MNRRDLIQIYYNEMLEKFLLQFIDAFKDEKPETVFELNEVEKFRQLADLENVRVDVHITQSLIECYVIDKESHYTKYLLIPMNCSIETTKKVSVIQYTGQDKRVKELINDYKKLCSRR